MTTIRDEVLERGFAFRAKYFPGLNSKELSLQVGEPISLHSGCPVHSLTPAGMAERSPNSYSGIYGLGAFPMHTDLAHHRLPPRYFILRCCVPDEMVGTTLVDSLDIIATVGASLLSRALVQPRRPRAGVRPLLRLFDPASQVFRWDIEFIRPASDVGTEAIAAVSHALEWQSQTEIRLAQPGDTLVIDNWRMLHGRTAVLSVSRKRRIERVYLETLN